MTGKILFDSICFETSKRVTQCYSTSFSLGISLLEEDVQKPIYNIYAFVRFADEIVDTLHGFDKKDLLARFKRDTYLAIEEGISLNPVLNSFQETVNKYSIPKVLIETFFESMEMDLDNLVYTQELYERYILGSAEVVGLMCLKIFTDEEEYEKLKPFAMKLGSAFQKVNFLRDLNADTKGLGRLYFPNVDLTSFSEQSKKSIVKDIEGDFEVAKEGVRRLPKKCRMGVYLAYVYFSTLLHKIKNSDSKEIFYKRFSLAWYEKMYLLMKSVVRYKCIGI